MKWVERPCQYKRIFREKSEEIKLYLIHKNYALICFVIYNHEIECQPCCTQSQTCSIGKSIQMRGTSVSMKSIFHEKSEEINSYFIHQNYAPIRYVITL